MRISILLKRIFFVILVLMTFLRVNAQTNVTLTGVCNSCVSSNAPSSNGSAIISSFDNCSLASLGVLTQGTLISGVSQIIQVTVATAGSYSISATANGVTFASTGNLSTGSQTIVLTATGTPIASGTTTFTLNTVPNCSFQRTIASSSPLTVNCQSSMFAGVLVKNLALTASNTYTLAITNNSATSTTLNFATSDLVLSGVAGISVTSVSPSSTTISGGTTQLVTYTLSGTPNTAGTLTANWTNGVLHCNVSTNVANALPVINCNATSIVTNSYNLTTNNYYTGLIKIPYSVAVTGDGYSAQTIVSNGITFSRSAGVYALADTIIYNFSGNFTGTTNTGFSINLDAYAGGCSVFIFDAIRNAIVAGGNASDLVNYDNAAVNSTLFVSAASYTKIALINTAAVLLTTETTMNSSPANGGLPGTSVRNILSTSVGSTYFSANTYMVAFSVKTKAPVSGNTGGKDFAGTLIKFSSSPTTGFTNYASALPSLLATDLTRYYVVIKRPTNKIPTTPNMAYYNPVVNNDMIGAGSSIISANFCNNCSGDPVTTANFYGPLFIQAIQVTNKQW